MLKQSKKADRVIHVYMKHVDDMDFLMILSLFKDKQMITDFKRLVIFEKLIIHIILLGS